MPPTSLKVLVGNMSDIGRISVNREDIDSIVRDFDMRYLEVSAKQDFNIRRVVYASSQLFEISEQHVASMVQSGKLVPDQEVGYM